MVPFLNFFEYEYTKNNANYTVEKNGDIKIYSKKKIKKGDEIILKSKKMSNINRLLLEGKTTEKLVNYFDEYLISAFSPGLYYSYGINDVDYFKNYELVASTYPISCLNTLKFMVDTTFMNQFVDNDIIKSDVEELTPYIFKFRSINGDGDCFYRSLIFSFLENIIFNNKIMQMKELLILYHEKINKDNKLISQKEYLAEINELNISIVSEILYIIINQLETDISKAYIILLKAFLFCDGFDSSIIFFTRYLIYEFISSNENKLYSKEYQVEIGCLLPDLFIIDRGDKNEYKFCLHRKTLLESRVH